MKSDAAVFIRALERALGGDTFESLMDKASRAVQCGDLKRADEMLRRAVALGNYAAFQSKVGHN